MIFSFSLEMPQNSKSFNFGSFSVFNPVVDDFSVQIRWNEWSL